MSKTLTLDTTLILDDQRPNALIVPADLFQKTLTTLGDWFERRGCLLLRKRYSKFDLAKPKPEDVLGYVKSIQVGAGGRVSATVRLLNDALAYAINTRLETESVVLAIDGSATYAGKVAKTWVPGYVFLTPVKPSERTLECKACAKVFDDVADFDLMGLPIMPPHNALLADGRPEKHCPMSGASILPDGKAIDPDHYQVDDSGVEGVPTDPDFMTDQGQTVGEFLHSRRDQLEPGSPLRSWVEALLAQEEKRKGLKLPMDLASAKLVDETIAENKHKSAADLRRDGRKLERKRDELKKRWKDAVQRN